MSDPVYSAVPPEPATCPRCGKTPCACASMGGKPPLKQTEPVTLRLDMSGRKGKGVTLVEGLKMHPLGKEELLKRFQRLCGAGGTVKTGTIELQGDHRTRLKAELEKIGYRVR